ncbi:DUF2452 domain-containing protein [Jejudonia soesokkakensis]|uniref:DUF2452 domain-containing protein n=1 Tax=Jejudonia soesokkakensis TaxID=1323432 RepID=A0ABW2MR34_9FLAO
MKKEKSKKPDQVVYNEETKKYDASLKPYATNLGAPAIVMEDLSSWKKTSVTKANHHFKTKFEAIKKEYDEMLEAFEYNNLIYRATYSFEPILGQVYHLYRDKNELLFLSIISPLECSWDFVGSFRLNSDKLWEKVY